MNRFDTAYAALESGLITEKPFGELLNLLRQLGAAHVAMGQAGESATKHIGD